MKERVAPLVTVIRQPQRGGSQAFVSALARGLVERGHEVHLYAASGSEVPGVEVIDVGVDHRDLAPSLYRARGPVASRLKTAESAFARVYAAIGERSYDVVHNHAFDAPAISLARGLSATVVHTVHLPPDTEVARALCQMVRTEPPPTVACVSCDQASAWRHIVPVEAILPPYVPTRSIPFSPTGGDNAVFAGRLSPEKGVLEAILIAQRAGIQIDVFGDSYDAQYTREQIAAQAAQPAVAVHPGVAQPTLWDAMAHAAVVLCPAKWNEPFGMVAAEAQACGTPVVGFRRGALHEVVCDGVTGFLVAPGDLDAAADAVARVPALTRWACREHAEAHLDLELSLDAHEQLYERVAMLEYAHEPMAESGHWLAGRLAIVTGASRGIGAATAVALAGAGARTVLAARDRNALEAVARRIRDAGGEAVAVPTDVGEVADVERLFSAVDSLGPPGALVCAAGVLVSAPLAETTSEIWEQTLAVNLTGSFLCCRAAFRAMRPQGEGRIINIASLSGIYATEKFPGLTAYNVSKYGVIGLTEAIATEGKEHGVSAICLSPGAVDTQMLRRANPHLRPGLTPADVAQLILALLDSPLVAASGANIPLFSNA